jgi:hypothetical protein
MMVRNETMFAVLMTMAVAGKYNATVADRTRKLMSKYGFSEADVLALEAAQAMAEAGGTQPTE